MPASGIDDALTPYPEGRIDSDNDPPPLWEDMGKKCRYGALC